MQRRRPPFQLIWLIGVAVFVGRLASQAAGGAETKAPKDFRPERWEADIRAFEAADQTNPPPRHAIEFIGSSSLRRWTNAPAMLPGHRIFNRGFGGSHLADSVAFVDRIVIPYQPAVVVLYAGDNDINAGKSPEQVFADFKQFVAKIHAALPETRIACISIKPSPAREQHLDKVRIANRLIREFIEGDARLAFVDVFTPSLTPDGRPREDLYLKDGLHPNAAGYTLWATVLKATLDRLSPPSVPEKSVAD